jgi:hypothetical protein
MQLFEVIRWGNDSVDTFTGGPDGPDTCFLVRATSIEHAAALVDEQLSRMPSERVSAWAGAIYQLGTDSSGQSEARILRGPYIQHAYRHGWRHWYRHDPNGPWVETAEA